MELEKTRTGVGVVLGLGIRSSGVGGKEPTY